MEIKDATELRATYGPASETSLKKEQRLIDRFARDFIARSPFLVIATSDKDGWPDASPKGDAPGFVVIEDEHRLLIPDRPGNNRLDSFQNLMSNPKVGIIFFVPGRAETLRVNGTARLLMDAPIRERLGFRGKPARAVLEVTATSVYFHCSKCVVRSGLWDKTRWPALDGLATAGEALAAHTGTTVADVEKRLEESVRERLY